MIDGKAIFEFGTGDITVVVGRDPDSDRIALFMKTTEKREPGLYLEEVGFEPRDSDAVMLFTSCEYALETLEAWATLIKSAQNYIKKEKEDETIST